MENWKWLSIRPSDTKFFDFYMRAVRKYCNITGNVKIKWRQNSKTYKFVFDKVDEDIYGIEIYERTS